MKPLEYARKKIFLWQNSPVSGAFDERKYPFVIEPLSILDNVRVKSCVLYGPTQSFKTVVLQTAIAYFLDVMRKSVLAVAQSDDDARSFSKIKLTPWLERIESLHGTVRNDRNAITLNEWLWATHELIISGPGQNARESKSVSYICTDEAHRWCVSNPGALSALRNRMGGRWDRMEFHATTAADAGTEIDVAYHKGQQAEWHVACPKCQRLVWLLWKETSRAHYNGHEVFQWQDCQSDTDTLESLRVICPHCQKQIADTPKSRIEMDEGAQYVVMNADADISNRSFRWNAFAPRWKSHRDLLAIYLSAIQSAKLGDLAPYQDWVKKQEVRSWIDEYPMLGDSTRGRDYSIKDIVIDVTKLRTCSFDVQEGEKGEGFHIWGLIEEWDKDGSSKRIAWKKLPTWADARKFQLENLVADKNTCVDFGARDREVFSVCNQYHWLAVKSGDEAGFNHCIVDPVTHIVSHIELPYSETRLESVTGRPPQRGVKLPSRGICPPGFAIARLWSKPRLYPVLYALKEGSAGRYYGIASDFDQEFVNQLHSYTPMIEKDAKTGVPKKMIWRKIKHDDHAFVCAAQGLLMAVIAGFYDMSGKAN